MINACNNLELTKNIIINAISENKGYNLITLDIHKKTSIAKYMVIASGNSARHVKALANHIIKNLKYYYYDKINVEGINEGNWVVINFKDIIVHIFRPEVREYYKIEEIWN